MISEQTTDVAIAGAGMAGLTLALQLKQQQPELDVTLIERNAFPLPEATAKVGESTVEIGAHYLESVLQQRQHLQDSHLPKFGLRCFFGSPESDFAALDELGVSKPFGITTYQIDRGVLENHLAEEVVRHGVKLYSGAAITRLELDAEGHRLATDEQTFRARWLIDASGRRGLLKRRLNLAKENSHSCSAVWFRINRTIKVDDWSDSGDWSARCEGDRRRYLSTNHLMGSGYWVWIIPLRSGVTSIGIVFNCAQHRLQDMNNYEKAQQWLRDEQPRCAAAIEGASALDFRYMNDYSYDCKQVFSSDRWALTGEAGIFLDPFYSPGSDFIAIGNGYICDLIRRETQGEKIRIHSAVYQQLYSSFYNTTLSLYQGEYPGFGDSKLMTLKLLWDYSFYWGVLGWLYFKERYLDIDFMQSISQKVAEVRACNESLQGLFQERADEKLLLTPEGKFFDQQTIPCLAHFNEVLATNSAESASREQLERNIEMLKSLALIVEGFLNEKDKGVPAMEESQLVGALRQSFG